MERDFEFLDTLTVTEFLQKTNSTQIEVKANIKNGALFFTYGDGRKTGIVSRKFTRESGFEEPRISK